MKGLIYLIAGALGFLGLMFFYGASHANAIFRIASGLVCMIAAFALVAVFRMQPVQHVHRMELDVSGDVQLEQTKCNQCGAELSTDSVKVAAGAVYINCEYCGSNYQIEEEPKW